MGNLSHPVARVYAAALMEFGVDQTALGAIYDDLQAVRGLYDGDAWFRQFFTSPRVDRFLKWRAKPRFMLTLILRNQLRKLCRFWTQIQKDVKV